MEFVEVDGSQGEGGGQILRTAVAFSSVLGKPVRVTRIRAGRGVPGLKRQHISALEVLKRVFGARLVGASEGSPTIEFIPGESTLSSLSVDMGTAASITLVLQAVIPAVALTGKTLRLELKGGTDVPWSPTFDYLGNLVREAYGQIGITFDVKADRRGYYPRGGGKVTATIDPCTRLKPLDLVKREELLGARILSRCGNLPRHVAERQLSAASEFLENSRIKVQAGSAINEASDSPGSSILVHVIRPDTFIGTDAIGAKGKRSEEVGKEAAARFVDEARSGACMDPNLADMVLPLLALAPSPSRVRVREVTSHLKSGMEIAGKFTPCTWAAEPQERSLVVRVNPAS